jgi:serine/alanine adding enzyme
MEILFNDSIPLFAWQELLSRNPYATPFQSSEFYNLYNSVNNLSAQAIAVSDSDSLKALVVVTLQREQGVKGYFSRRGIIYGGPLIDITHPEAFDLLLKQISKTLKKKAIFIETRNFSDYSDFKDVFLSHGWNYVPYYNVQINLLGQSKKSFQYLFNYNRRREIRQSINQGASYITCDNDKQVIEVYEILRKNYKERVKLPLPPIDFFLKYFHTQDLRIFAVLHNEKIIGGAFCPVLKRKKLFTFYYCGLRDYHKKIFPTHLAILASIEYCIENQIPHFNFMGAGKPEINYGVRNYKLEFGGELVEYGRFVKINNHLLYQMGRYGISVIKKL